MNKAKPKRKKNKPGQGRKPIDPKLKRVSKTYRLAPLTLRKIRRHQITTGIKTAVGALESMLAPYEPQTPLEREKIVTTARKTTK